MRVVLTTIALSAIVARGLFSPDGAGRRRRSDKDAAHKDATRPSLSENTKIKPNHEDIKFKGNLKLDLFIPETNSTVPGKIPALIYVHGGEWKAGDKTPIRDWAMKVRDDHGCAIVSIQYRLTGDAPWPAQGEDMLDAIKWVKTKGPEYGIDAHRVGCLGESSGAHLCNYMATAGAVDSTTRLNVAISMFGQTCFLCQGFTDHVLGPFKNRDDPEGTTQSQDYFFGFKAGELKKLKEAESSPSASEAKNIELVQSAEPLYQLMHTGKQKTSSIFMAHGTDDMEIPYEQTKFFTQQLSAFGVPHKLLTIPKGGHAYEGWTDKHILQGIDFMKAHIGVQHT